jgi:hypothetical protein
MDLSLRRAAVRASSFNAIDTITVIDQGRSNDVNANALRRLLLAVRLFRPAPAGISAANVRIEGGVRINPVRVLWALPYSQLGSIPNSNGYEASTIYNAIISPDPTIATDVFLFVRVDLPGDFSRYRLRLGQAADPSLPLDGFDPRLSEIDFTFKLDCPPELDEPLPVLSPAVRPQPEIDYLAKDYGSFRRLMLDRLSMIAPDWKERNPADLGVALVELLAYVGDHLSYFQDAVATEAYLGTARQRISVRRHARLAGYHLGEGVNARTWVTFEMEPGSAALALPPGVPLLTRGGGLEAVIDPATVAQAVSLGATVFETLHDVTLHPSHNEIAIYTWTDSETVLPAGATAATLVRTEPPLQAGDPLLFEELVSPRTGDPADAALAHRHVVRLTSVRNAKDPLTNQDIQQIRWDVADALPFPLVLSAVTDEEHGSRFLQGVSVARGNLVLADHGWTIDAEEDLGTVPADRPFRPLLRQGPLTHAVPLPSGWERLPASALLQMDAAEPMPALQVRAPETGEIWPPRRDLVSSGPFASELVAEIQEDGRARLRFGNDVNGKAPAVGRAFVARYRIGQGVAGNIGADAIRYAGAGSPAGIVRVRNPLPGMLGQEPESLEEARRFAPRELATRQRAVSEADWAALASRHPLVQGAAASFRWTGSWRTVSIAIDRIGGARLDADLELRLRRDLEPYLIAGYDLEIRAPRLVPIDLTLQVCVLPGYFRRQVEIAVAERLSARNYFHPDRWTFGQPVTLSQIYDAVREVEGVESVRALRFQRWGRPADHEIDNGVLPIDRLEVAVLANDPGFRENGRLEIQIGGGR